MGGISNGPHPCPFADVMVLNDIIEQAAGRHSRASDRGGKTHQIDTKNGLLPGLMMFDCYTRQE